MQKIKIFIISLKDSPRIFFLKKNLDRLKIKYQIIYGYDSRNITKKQVAQIYNEPETIRNIGRALTQSEICISANHLQIYNTIIKKKIKEAIILEDDVIISNKIWDYISSDKLIDKNEIISLIANPNGFVQKKYYKKNLNNMKVYEAKTHLYSCGAYHLNYETCKKIIAITNNKVLSFPDWQFLLKKNNIKLFVTLPFLALIHDRGFSYLQKDRNKILRKKLFPNSLFVNMLRNIIHLLCLPYLLGIYKNKDYYIEYFFYKSLIRILNFFTNIYWDLEKIYYDKNFYETDIKNKVNNAIKKSYSYKFKN